MVPDVVRAVVTYMEEGVLGAVLRKVEDEAKEQAKRVAVVRDPTTWTILQYYGRNQLGLRYNMLPAHQMALITSGCVPFRRTTSSA